MDIKDQILFKELGDTSIYLDHPELSFEACSEEIHMIGIDKRVYRGGEVVSELIKEIPGVSKLSWLLDSESSKKTMDLFYQSLNRIRTATRHDCPKCNKSKKSKS